jgi:hypothetical protein
VIGASATVGVAVAKSSALASATPTARIRA